MKCKSASDYYGVPADIGRRVIVSGRPGIISADRGNYIGVNFDDDKPGVILNCHPTWRVEYQGIGQIRRQTRGQERYARYLESSECYDDFLHFLRCEANP